MQIGTIPNWTPAVDFVTTNEFSSWNQTTSARGHKMVPWEDSRPGSDLSEPDRIFAATGRGVTGVVTEYRHGIPANIGLDIAYNVPIKQSWIFPADLSDAAQGFHMLLSMPDSSAILHLSEDLADVDEPDSITVQYDLSSRTIQAAQVSDDMIVQVTENYLVLVSATQRCVKLSLPRASATARTDAPFLQVYAVSSRISSTEQSSPWRMPVSKAT